MHTTRAMLEAEGLLLASTGILAVGVPQAFVGVVGGGYSAPVELLVALLGSVVVVTGILQCGLLAVGQDRSLRVLLQARLVGDLLMVGTTLLLAWPVGTIVPVVRLVCTSLVFFFGAVRFYALVLLSERDAELVVPAEL
ncbi:MAG TPA: hypothetical protein PKA64_05190 [Myxococcota bacterium]|nr:hypothetical protein [Myxococcota bacterium]